MRLKYILIAVAVFAVVAAVGVMFRLKQVERARRDALEAVVSAETLALRISDKNAFMFRQGPADDWREHQRETFNRFISAQESVIVTDEILDVEMAGDQARVSVRVMVNEQPDQAVWLYEYTDKGWRHIATEAEPWSPSTHETAWFTFHYYTINKPLVEELDPLLTGWWQTAIRMTGRNTPLELAITIDEQADEIAWADNDQTELVIPAVDEEGTPLTSLPRPMRSRLAELMANRWVDHARVPNERGQDSWFSYEVRQMLWHAFDPAWEASAPVLESLSVAFSPEIIPATFRSTWQYNEVPEAVQQAMAVTARRDLQGQALLDYLTHYLRAEAAFDQDRRVEAINPQSYAGRLFLDQERAVSGAIYNQTIGLASAPLESIRVLNVRQFGDVLWAYTEFDMIWWWLDEDRRQTVTTFIPFRFVNGHWTHTAALETDWGLPLVAGGPDLSIRYYALDEPYIGTLREDLAMMYARLASDFRIDIPADIEIAISPTPSTDPNPGGQAIRPEVYSLHAVCCSTGANPAQSLHSLAATSLAMEVYNYRFLEHGPLPSSAVSTAFMSWEIERLGSEFYYDWVLNARPVHGARLPASLNDLWDVSMRWEDAQSHYELSTRLLGIKVLLDLLVERYGEGIVPDLVDHLYSASSTEAWLSESIGVEAADLEAEWQQRFTAQLAQRQIASTQ